MPQDLRFAGFLAGMGIPVPDWLAYGPIAIVLCMSMHYYAFSYIMVSGALRSINSELEEMGEIQGASKPLILRKITLPLVLPAMLSAVILTFSKAIGTFGTINYLGSPVSFRTGSPWTKSTASPLPPAMPMSASRASPGPLTTQPMTATLMDFLQP